MTRSLRKKAKGFTLLELLIVVAIIGVLAAIAVPSLVNASVRSRYSRALADTKLYVSSIQLFRNDNPTTTPTQALVQGGNYMANTTDPFAAVGVNYAAVFVAPFSAVSIGVDGTGVWPVAATAGAGYGSGIGCAVGTSAQIPAGVRC